MFPIGLLQDYMCYMCHDDYYDDDGNYRDDDDKCFKWYDGHKNRKAH